MWWTIAKTLFGGGLTSITNAAGGIIKTIWGDRAEKDRALADEQMEVQKGYQAEFLAPEKIHWFNILMDGLNRMVRPLFSYGIVALFTWAAIDPVEFTYTMQAMTVIPEMLWYIFMTIIAFWFGSRLLESAPKGFKLGTSIEDAQRIATQIDYHNQLEDVREKAKDIDDFYDPDGHPDIVDPTPIPGIKPNMPVNRVGTTYQVPQGFQVKTLAESNASVAAWKAKQGQSPAKPTTKGSKK